MMGKERLRLVAERDGWRLVGRKVLCSASFIERPLVTARTRAADFSCWCRGAGAASAPISGLDADRHAGLATGCVHSTGLRVRDGDIIGDDARLSSQPAFSGSAWRFAAVQLGGTEACSTFAGSNT